MHGFFEFPCPPPPTTDPDFAATAIAHHPRLQLTAAATPPADGSPTTTLTLYSAHGTPLANVALAAPARLAWHPHDALVAVASAAAGSGAELLLVAVDDADTANPRVVRAALPPRTAPATALAWSPDGARLVVATAAGAVMVAYHEPSLDELVVEHTMAVGDPVSHIVFRTSVDAAGDAVAAPGHAFFVANAAGAVFLADQYGECTQAFSVSNELRVFEFDPPTSSFVTITRGLIIARHVLNDDGSLTLKMKAKYATAAKNADALTGCWTLPGVLATVAREPMVRLWDFGSNTNYILSLAALSDSSAMANDRIVTLAFSAPRRTLAVGTEDGKVVVWRYTGVRVPDDPPEAAWDLHSVVQLPDEVVAVAWGGSDGGAGHLTVATASGISILLESPMHARLGPTRSALQFDAEWLALSPTAAPTAFTGALEYAPLPPAAPPLTNVQTGIRILGMDMVADDDEPGTSRLLVWNGAAAHYYTVAGTTASLVRELPLAATAVALHRDTIIAAVDSRVTIANDSGIVKETLSFLVGEGNPRLVDVCGSFLAVFSTASVLKLWNLSRRKAHQYYMGRTFTPDELFATVETMAINADGTRVAFTGSSPAGPGTSIVVFEYESDSVVRVDLGAPVDALFWSSAEPRLLAAATAGASGLAGGAASAAPPPPPSSPARNALGRKLKRKRELPASPSAERLGGEVLGASAPAAGNAARPGGPTVVTLFATPSAGVLVQSKTPFPPRAQRLLGIEVPYLVFALQLPVDGSRVTERVGSWPMQEFVGMDEVSEGAFAALLDFSYHLTIGNMDEAFKAVKLIESDTVWQNMAAMCVKTRRLDVAEICLANMGHVRGVRALREARKVPEPAARVAMLAIQLGELEAAADLYREAERPDLLNALYQASNQWRAAVEVAETSDRIHLRNTYYNFGKYLESIGETTQALQAYERAGLAAEQVPRLLAGDLPALEKYVNASDDPALTRWWAQFAEVNGAFDQALMYYERAGNYRALIKILVYHDDFAKAAEVCDATSDPAACYLFARYLEARGDVDAALNYYNKSGRVNHAIELGIKARMDNMVLQMALQAANPVKLRAAAYFEGAGAADRAIILYHRGGKTAKAVDLAFATESFDALRELAESLDSSTDPALLARCATFFLDHGQYDKAVAMYIAGGQKEVALKLAVDEKIAISEEMAEALSPDASVEPEARARQLAALGSVLARQGSYHLACKKYTHAGDKVTAMKCLLKSGDTERIIFFANVCRKREVFILAANYLQQEDWQANVDLRKAIILFYTKAKQAASLARFYDACATLEVDDYRNYDQAANALAEGVRVARKALDAGTSAGGLAALADAMDAKLAWIRSFADARAANDAPALLAVARSILAAQDERRGAGEDAVRPGDVYEVLITLALDQGDTAQAFRLLGLMVDRGIDVKLYLERDVVERVCAANSASVDAVLGLGGGESDA